MSEHVKNRSEIDDKYKWDLSKIYKNLSDFEEDFDACKKLISGFKKVKKNMMKSADNLYALLEEDSKIDMKLNKLYMYAHLNKDSDTTNQAYQELFGRVYSLLELYSEEFSDIIPYLLKYDYSVIEKYYNENSDLLKYKFTLEKIYRNKPHVLSKKEEKLLSNFSGAFGFSERIYDVFTNAELELGKIKDEEGKEVELNDSNFSIYLKSDNRDVRKDAFLTLYNGYSKYKDTISMMLSNDIKINNINASVRKYKSAMECSMFDENINIDVYNNLVNTVESNLDSLHEYLKLKKDILKLDEIHLYDVYAPMIKNSNTRYTFEEAKSLVKDALSVLGEEYIENLDRAFNESWIDIYPNKGKVSGAYSSGSYSTNAYILLNFMGELNDVSTLAHELGHSMHSYYSKQNNTYQDYQYKIFVAEVASTVNELLLSKYMLKNSNNNKEKLNILNRILELFRTTLFRQTMFSSFEKEIYSKEKDGVILTSDTICDIYYKLNQKYFGNDVIVDDEIKYEWERIPHFYYNFYVYKYATGISAACFIANRILNNEENALEDYLSFLKTGGRYFPLDELKIAGVDMTDKKVIESAISMFKSTLDEFKHVYNEEYDD